MAKALMIGIALVALVGTPAYAGGCRSNHTCPSSMKTGDPNYLKQNNGSTTKPKTTNPNQPHS
jgi:hypothetical protein